MAVLTLSEEIYRDKVLGAWQGKSAGVTLGIGHRGQLAPGHNNYYSPVPGQPAANLALDFPLVWLAALEKYGPDITPEDLAVAWLEHLDYHQDEFGYAALNLRRGLPPPASGAHSNWFRHATGGVMRAEVWALVAPGAPQTAAAYAYHDAKLDHCEDGLWAAMFLAAVGSAAFFLSDPLILVTIGLAMMPRTCRTARAIKTAIAAAQRSASWLEARECVQHEAGDANFTDVAQNMGFFTIGLFYGRDFGSALCAAVNCGYDTTVVGGALGAVLGILDGATGLPPEWIGPLNDLMIPDLGMRDFDAPTTLTEVAGRTVEVGKQVVAARCPEVEIAIGEREEGVREREEGRGNGEEGVGSREEGRERGEEAGGISPSTATAAAGVAPPPTAMETEGSEPVGAVPLDSPTAETGAASTVSSGPPTEPDKPDGVLDAMAQLDAMEKAAAAAAPVVPEPVAPGVPAAGAASPELPSASREGEGPAEAQAASPEGAPAATPALLGVLAPQPVSEAAAPTPEIAPDPVSAIAWADNTQVKPLLITAPHTLIAQSEPFEVFLDTGDSPTIAPGQAKVLAITIFNRGDEPFSGRLQMMAPPGWQVSMPPGLGQRQYIAAHTGAFRGEFTVRAIEATAHVDIGNMIRVRFIPEGGEPRDTEFVLVGASCWWTVGPFANFDGEGFDRSYKPEDRPALDESYVNRTGQSVRWARQAFPEAVLPLDPLFRASSGVCYGQTVLRSPTAREARLVANTNSGVKVWLNGALVIRRFHREVFRPVLGEGPWAADILLRAGDNPVLVKWVRGSEPYEFSLTVSDRDGRGLPEVGNTSW